MQTRLQTKQHEHVLTGLQRTWAVMKKAKQCTVSAENCL